MEVMTIRDHKAFEAYKSKSYSFLILAQFCIKNFAVILFCLKNYVLVTFELVK